LAATSGSGVSTSGGNSSTRGSSIASRFRQPHVPLWHRQPPPPPPSAVAQAWCNSCLSPGQAIAVISAYTGFDYYPGAALLDSILLAVRPQLPYMAVCEVSELLVTLAALRHVPGPQTLEIMATAALFPCTATCTTSPCTAAAAATVPGSATLSLEAPQPLHGRRPRQEQQLEVAEVAVGKGLLPGEAAVQRLRSLWALVMVGWRPAARTVEEVLAPVLPSCDDDVGDDACTPLDCDDATRLFSLLAMLPQEGLTVKRFGLGCMRAADALRKAAEMVDGGGISSIGGGASSS
ncbi:hypothetical protein Agub_g14521, partial [Astrephomene gubernaculifera]